MSLQRIPNELITLILEYAIEIIDDKTNSLRNLCNSFETSINDIFWFHVDSLRGNPVIRDLIVNVNDMALAQLIPLKYPQCFEYDTQMDQLGMLIEFLRRPLFEKSLHNASFSILERIVTLKRKELFTIDQGYFDIFLIMLVELIMRNCFNSKIISVATKFFDNPPDFFQFMTQNLPREMQQRNVPRDEKERNRLIALIEWFEIKIFSILLIASGMIASIPLFAIGVNDAAIDAFMGFTLITALLFVIFHNFLPKIYQILGK